MSVEKARSDAVVGEPLRRAQAALYSAVGERIRAARVDARIGQAECARAAGINKSTMFRIERGEHALRIDTLARLALVIGVTVDEFLIGVRPDPALISNED